VTANINNNSVISAKNSLAQQKHLLIQFRAESRVRVFTGGMMTATVAAMSQKEIMVSLQFQTPLQVRAKLRSVASLEYLDMGETATAILRWAFGVLDAGKPPAALTAEFDKARREKARRKREADAEADD
jgi:hypothetical protein